MHPKFWDGPTGPVAPIGLFLKRVFDLVLALFLLALFAPLLITIAVIVKLTSPGPVFYRGVRGGLHGNTFRIFKFRTMVVDAEKLGGPTTSTDDPRVTSIGRLLRKTKLDELPQLLNVLRGDMSFVGPRPEVMQYVSRYSMEERIILAMQPGITDYASIEFADLDDQVGRENADTYFQEHILPEKNRLRVKYVSEWSFCADLVILWNTGWRVLKRCFWR